jgi:MOSC domain-containing protein YiiM
MATIVAIHLKPIRGQPMQSVAEVEAVAGRGLRGDHHFGERIRQVLAIEQETLDELRLAPGALRENIVIAGLALAGTAPGRRLRVGGALLEVTRDCAPCAYVESVRLGLRDLIRGRRGTLCRVILGGRIALGDAAAWETP